MNQSSLMHKVLTGSANDQEVAELEKWLAASPGNREEFNDLKILYSISSYPDDELASDRDDSWQRLVAAIDRARKRAKWLNLLKTLGLSAAIYAAIVLVYAAPVLTDRFTGGVKHTLTRTAHFKNVPLGDVLRAVDAGDAFSVTLAPPDLARCKFTGSFKQGTPYRNMIETIAKAKDFDIRYTSDHTIVLSGNGCGK